MVKYYLADQLGTFRSAASEDDMNQSLALMCVLLLAADERTEFGASDGATALGDHLIRLCHEQAAERYRWKGSKAFGFNVSEKGLHQLVRFLLVSIVHASLEASMAAQFCSANLPQLLFDEFVVSTENFIAAGDMGPNQDTDSVNATPTTPLSEVSLRILALEGLRNLCYADWPRPQLNNSALDTLWQMFLATSTDSPTSANDNGDQRDGTIAGQLACDILSNLASHAPRASHATKDRVSSLLTLLICTHDAKQSSSTLDGRNLCPQLVAMADLAANLARDTEYSIVLICSLEQLKPRTRANTSSLAFLTQWADNINEDAGLRASLRSLNHNLAWTDVSTKVCVQKLAASTFLERFLHVHANQ